MLTLICQYYVPKDRHRREEIDTCFHKNIENPLVTKMLIFFERKEDMALLPDIPKIEKRFYADRLTYGFWLKETNKFPAGTLSLVINSDIYLTESVSHLISNKEYILKEKKFVALTRYNPNVEGEGFVLNGNPHWTQDAWAVVKPEPGFSSALIQETSFELGQPGCDNKIVAVMHSYGFNVTNPCGTVHTIHLQSDEKRSYDGRANKLIGLHAFSYATNTVFENSHLEFDLLSRNLEPYEEIRVNNWINDAKSYSLKPETKEIQGLKEKYKKNIETYEPSYEPVKIEPDDEYQKANGYSYIGKNEFIPAKYNLLHTFDQQYKIYEDSNFWYCHDQYWPYVRRVKRNSLRVDKNNKASLISLFATGFLPSVLALEGIKIGVEKKHDTDVLFWQMPAKTEFDAFERHNNLPSPQIDGSTVNVYIGLPWATIIDQLKFNPAMGQAAIPKVLIGTLAMRIKTARKVLKQLGASLRIHTVCQQIYWNDIAEQFAKLGITDLWLAHKTKTSDHKDGMDLHAWPLYAVNIETPKRRSGLKSIPVDERKYLASFIGAYMEHYGNDTRPKMVHALKESNGYCLKLNDMWHFNEEVYNQQLGLQVEEISTAAQFSVSQYNEVLSDSQFSLCPIGAGPNTIRLWESLAMGSIPFVISDAYEFPELRKPDGSIFNWTDAVVIHAERDLIALDERLRSYSPTALASMSDACHTAYGLILTKSCFGVLASRNGSAHLADIPKPKPIKVYIPYYGPEDKYFWRTHHHGLYDLIMAWHERGWCDIEHHDGPYYWVNEIGSILLFDRDQVADLIDKKKPFPRWEGEVPYKYAFFTNGYGLDNDRNLKFNYWSYNPMGLEDKVNSAARLTYNERTISSVFLGSVENESQEYFRNRFKDWGAHIGEFYIADKLNKKEKAKYTFGEYLEKVAQSKFGVSFRGNGPKCYREIEYAAMGTPLIITEGVDVDYPDPLIEGVHYFRAKNPEDIPKFVAETSASVWEEMSQNCRNWYLKNFTLDSQYQSLKHAVKHLNVELRKPEWVCIKRIEGADYDLTLATLKIFNPTIEVLDSPRQDARGMMLEAGSIVINELPYLGGDAKYLYAVGKDTIDEYKSMIMASNIEKYKRLSCLLKWRLRDFKVSLHKSGVHLPVENFIDDDGRLSVQDNEVSYDIEIDYDFCRQIHGKYLEKRIQGKGSIKFPQKVLISAVLYIKVDDAEIQRDITSKYSEYMSVYEDLVRREEVWRKFKLWEFESSEFNRIVVKYNFDHERTFVHEEVKFYPVQN